MKDGAQVRAFTSAPTAIPGAFVRGQIWPCPHGLLRASTHEAHTAQQGMGEAVQPWKGAATCQSTLKASNACNKSQPSPPSSAGAALGCRLVPREGVLSWDRAVGSSKCRCWSLLWCRPGYPAWLPSHFSETVCKTSFGDSKKKLIQA